MIEAFTLVPFYLVAQRYLELIIQKNLVLYAVAGSHLMLMEAEIKKSNYRSKLSGDRKSTSTGATVVNSN